ncbi:hypothetical protein AX15_007902 [Amanita polypyramis BW_CC]|nr:hypothetical protein AX15_007902 [Amanita polypyramis BW_CC]
MTPVSFSPSAHFLSLSLSRPGSDTIPSLLGIGRHPNSMVSDPGKIHYSTLVSERNGALYWKVGVRAITVYVNGTARQIEIGRSSSGMVFPTALLDSGIPLILTTSNIANAIYGALGIGPAADGHYYVPCTTPLNMTITLDNRPEIPLHPLDLTAEPQDNNRAQYCVGLIQADDAQLANPSSGIGDMILGVPFLRNTYTVMAYTTPYENGSFPDPATLPSDLVIPNLGLLSLTDPSVALDEFKTVRLLNQPISSGNHHNGDAGPTTVGPKKLSIGVIVLIALIGFFSLCCALFGLRWYLLKRKFRKDGAGLDLENKTAGTRGDSESSIIKGGPDKASVYAALKASRSFEEERLKSMEAYEEYASGGNGDGTAIEARPDDPPRPRERVASERTVSSGRTVVEKASPASELGYGVGVGIGGKDVMKDSFGSRWSMAEEMFARHSVRMSHRSNSMGSTSQTQSHDRNASLFVPLLSSPHHHRRSQSIDTDRVVSPIASPTTAMFGSEAGPVEENTSSRHIPSAVSDLEKVEEREMPGPESGPVEGNEDSGRAPESVPNLGELGYRHSHPDSDDGGGGGGGTLGSTGSMAGIGTAAVARRRIESLSFPRESFFSTTSSMVIASATGEEHRHPPPAVDSEEAEPPTPPPRDGAVRFPSPAFIPSGTRKPGDCARPASTSMLDDFDPYAEYPLR